MCNELSQPFAPFAEIICKDAKRNEQFARSCPVASDTLKLFVDIWDYTFDIWAECLRSKQFGGAVPLTLLHIVQPQIYGMIYNFLLGNLPACYMSMRVVLEAVVDAVIVSTRFYDSPFPDNLRHLRRLERETRMTFADKCRLLIPASAQSVVKNINELWSYLSEYWAHAKGIIRKLNDKIREAVQKGQTVTPPMWSLALPYPYDETDIDDLREFANRLRKLNEVVETLLEPFTKAKTLREY
ncbi:MAG: hypothetical protein ACTSXC_04740 [Candidatus Freyarchaeota archaeon]